MIAAKPISQQGKRGQFGIRLLSSIAFVSVLTCVALFISLVTLETRRNAVVREDAMWAVFNTDRELRTLWTHTQLIEAERDRASLDALIGRYDILYSRVAQLTRTRDLLDIGDGGLLISQAAPIVDFIIGLAPEIDSLDAQADNYFERISDLGHRLGAYIDDSNDLLLSANAELNRQRVEDRDSRRWAHGFLALLGVLLTSAFLGIFQIMLLQMRSIRRHNKLMALQRERSIRTAARAKAARNSMSVFLATMSHEIRTPLNGIIGSAELLSIEEDVDTQKRRLEAIRASGFLLRDLIDDILALSRLRAEGVEQEAAETDLPMMGTILYNAFAHDASTAGLSLSITMPPVRVLMNASPVRQVLVNLIGNAIKFTPSGDIRVQGTMVTKDRLRLSVSDDGIGISAENIPKLFNDFTQLDGAYSRSYQGSGLGLAISKRLIEGMGGRIGVESALGKGSTFWFEISVTLLDTPADLQRQVTAPRPAGSGLRILIAEDNEVNLCVLRDMLHHLGHSVIETRNGKEALERLSLEQLDLLLIDCQMPVMDGIEATRLIRKSGCALPIIGVSANSFDRDRRRCMKAGMDEFLSKPLTFASLTKAIDSIRRKIDRTNAPETRAGSTASNEHLRLLAETLGVEALDGFLKRFECEITNFETDALASMKTGDQEAQQFALHKFIGAAQTLGLAETTAIAARMRDEVPFTREAVMNLVAHAQSHVASARKSVASMALA